MSKKIEVDKVLLQKFAEFIDIALSEIKGLRNQVSYHLTKQAEQNTTLERYQESVIKVSNALYNSDLDFVVGDFDRRKFIKRAMEDPSYLARTLEKVCNAADVTNIGKPARVAVNKQAAMNDPVYARAFGLSREVETLIDLDE